MYVFSLVMPPSYCTFSVQSLSTISEFHFSSCPSSSTLRYLSFHASLIISTYCVSQELALPWYWSLCTSTCTTTSSLRTSCTTSSRVWPARCRGQTARTRGTPSDVCLYLCTPTSPTSTPTCTVSHCHIVYQQAAERRNKSCESCNSCSRHPHLV